MRDFSFLSDDTYYRATSPHRARPSLAGRADAAVCIVGGGFAGLATALSLIELGERDVIVLEAENLGHGASGRNGGFVFGGFSLDERSLVTQAGVEHARRLYRLTTSAAACIRHRIDRYGIDCDATYSGIYLANWFDDDRLLDARQRFMADNFGIEWQRIPREQLAERLLTQRYFGGLYEADAFHFHPLKYAHGMADVTAAGGGRLCERSRVTQIRPHRNGWRVSTAQGEVHARDVVVCCGGYIERLHPTLAGAILPIATYVMVTEPLEERLQSVLRTNAAVYDTRFAFDYYRPLPDSRLLWGGRISIRDRSARDVARLLYGDMRKVYPQLDGVRIDYAWSGLMSYGRHKMPQLGRLPEGIWYAMGFGGHGVATTTLAGEVLARGLMGEVSDLQRFASWGLPAAGGKAGLLAAQMTYWYYALQDWLRR
ncbi:MAG TPA: FAD-binding oxidoreductase [Noviherbaspirillum sp.]